MYTKYFLFAFLFFSLTIFAQHSKTPQKVSETFSKLYPKATNVKWDKEGNNYEASFKLDSKNISVTLDANGNVIETETEIEKSQLPNGVEKFIQDNYKEYKISEAAKIVKADGETVFEAEILKGKTRKDLLFDANGKIEKKNVNKKMRKDKEDEEDKD